MAMSFRAPSSAFSTVPGANRNAGGGTPSAPATSPSGIPTYAGAEVSDTSAVPFIAAWALVLFLVLLMNRTRWGHAVIYFGLALCLLLLLLVNYQAIATLLAPAGGGPDAGSEDPAAAQPLPVSGAESPATMPIAARAPTFQITS